MNSDVIQSFEILFSKLNAGGYYCIEDTQVSGIGKFHNNAFPNTIEYFMNIQWTNAKIEFFKNLIIVRNYQ
jgi:hypothetical protein